MTLLKRYTLGFDFWGLLLFLLVMIPNIIWFALPAPNDVLRAESLTPVVDMVASACQVVFVACLCFVVNIESKRGLRLTPLVIATVASLLGYYTGWVLYYLGIVESVVILMLTLLPCAAFIFFAVDRKNLPTIVFATLFAVCHLIFGVVNFIV